MEAELQHVVGRVPRLFLLESEYMRSMLLTELDWVASLIEDLRAKRLSWSEEEMRAFAEQAREAPESPA
jgi:hypothetical protein